MSSAAEAEQPREHDLPGLPHGPLVDYLRTHVPRVDVGTLRTSLLSGGRSNLTYLLETDDDAWVLRRPPLGEVLATAHDVAREHALLVALHPTDVPVPEPLHLGDGEEAVAAVGAPFYLMAHAPGTVLRTAEQLARVADPGALADGLVATLVDLHAVDPERVGLGGLGRPEGYLARQLDRWVRQVSAIGSPLAGAFTDLADRLRRDRPTTQRTALVHGDYRLDNVVVDAAGRLTAVLDWEMATRGDPLADVASTLVWWDGTTGLDLPVATMPGAVAGYPAGTRLAEAYAAASDLDLAPLPWYLAFAYFKIAAIFEGIRHRADQGLTVGDGFDRLGPAVPELLERAHAAHA